MLVLESSLFRCNAPIEVLDVKSFFSWSDLPEHLTLSRIYAIFNVTEWNISCKGNRSTT